MFTTRHILIALVAATAFTGASVVVSGEQELRRIVKDQGRIGVETPASTSGAPWQVTVVRDGKTGRLSADTPCAGHSWPYVPAPCIVIAEGEAAPNAVRTVTVEQGSLTGSVLMRVPVTQVAAQ